GLLSNDSIVDGDVVVSDASRRNHNLKVTRRTAASFFLNQLQHQEPQAAESFRREASFYWLVLNDPDFAVLRAVAPRVHGYDPAAGVLVLEQFAGSTSLAELQSPGAAPVAPLLAELGGGLAAVHADAGRGICAGGASPFPRQPHWILSLHELPVQYLRFESQGTWQLVQAVRSNKEVGRVLTSVRTEWQADTLIHGDLKLDNCLVLPEPAAGGRVRIIDWELADVGDAAWDVGSVLQALWVPPMLRSGEGGEPAFEAACAFWSAYAQRRGYSAEASAAALRRAVRFGAARMVLSAYESMFNQPAMHGYTWQMLTQAVALFDEPAPLAEGIGSRA
ncbi:MAG: phosphotransferase family protein, partial [Longimicrobiales bacterium]